APVIVSDVGPELMGRETGRQQLRQEVQDVIASLLPDDPQRAFKIRLFRLYHLEGWTFQELADRHRISVTSAYQRVAQVRSAFEAAWAADAPTAARQPRSNDRHSSAGRPRVAGGAAGASST